MQDYGSSDRERLVRIETKLDQLRDSIVAHIKEDDEIFHGKGGNDEGLLIEHAKMLDTFKWWRYIIGTTLAAVLGVIVEVFFLSAGPHK